MERTLQQIVGTSEDIHWESINANDFTYSHEKQPHKLEGDAFVIIGKESPELTDMDLDLAINDPSRLKRRGAIPKEIIKLHVVMTGGSVDARETKVLNRWKDEKIILSCMKYRYSGRKLDKCLKEK